MCFKTKHCAALVNVVNLNLVFFCAFAVVSYRFPRLVT